MSQIALALYRCGAFLVSVRLVFLARIVKLFTQLLTAGEIDPRAKIGRGFRLPHPAGVVIGRGSVIGNDVYIGQHVTLGGNFGAKNGDQTYPKIGSHVMLAAGSAVIGPVTICDGVVVAINSVVSKSIQKSGVYGGLPARFIRELNARERTFLKLQPEDKP